MISLPSKWTQRFGINKGDEINIDEKDKALIISKDEINEEKKVAKINVSGWSPLINRILLSYFFKGYDEVEVHYSHPDEVKKFQKEIVNSELLSWEIIRQSNKMFVVKDLTGSEIGGIDDIIQRILFMLDTMIGELIEALEKKNDLQTVIETDKVVNRFTYYCLRLLNKKGYKEFEKTPQIYGIITIFEEIGDLLKEIAVLGKKSRIIKEDITVLKEIKNSLIIFKELINNFNKDSAIKLGNNYEKIKKSINKKSEIEFLLHDINENIIRMNNNLFVMNIEKLGEK